MLKKERNSFCRINEGVIELSLASDSFALLCTKQIRLNWLSRNLGYLKYFRLSYFKIITNCVLESVEFSEKSSNIFLPRFGIFCLQYSSSFCKSHICLNLKRWIVWYLMTDNDLVRKNIIFLLLKKYYMTKIVKRIHYFWVGQFVSNLAEDLTT